MKFLFSLLILGPLALFALETGQRYDFICSDGQDIFNAELTGEDSDRYYVKLSASAARVPLEKKHVIRTIRKSEQSDEQRKLTLTALPGLVVATGRLAGFSGFGPAGALIGDYALSDRWHLVLRGDAEQFSKEESRLHILFFSAGLQAFLPGEFGRFRFLAGVSAGGAYITAVSDTLRQTAIVPTGILWVGANRQISASWSFSVRLQGAYVYDRQTVVITPGIFFGVAYAL